MLPPDFGRIDFERAFKFDWRSAWQRGPHPAPQTDDMRQMLDDIAAEGWRH